MNKPLVFVSTLALASLVNGCAGSGPNTEQGAVVGGALGMISGAVIGHNSRNSDGATGAIVGGIAGATAGAVIGNSVDHERGTVYGEERRAAPNPDSRGYRVARAQAVATPATPPPPPPTPAETIPAQPAPNAVWVAGYWLYDGHSYTWMAGHWETPPPMAKTYVPAHYETRNGQTVYVPGYWQ
jgi:hypothetical protein